MLNVLDRLGFTRKRVSIVEKFQKPLNQAQFVSVKTTLNLNKVIIILYVMLSFVSYGLYLELVYMFGVTGNVQIMFIASTLT